MFFEEDYEQHASTHLWSIKSQQMIEEAFIRDSGISKIY